MLLFSNIAAQNYEVYDPYVEVVDYEFKLDKKLVKESVKRLYLQNDKDLYTYKHVDGFVTIGDHDRMSIVVYDEDLNWYQTRIYLYEEMYTNSKKLKTEYERILPAVEEAVLKSNSDVPEEEYYLTKIESPKGDWYEILYFVYVDTVMYNRLIILNDKLEVVSVTDEENIF